jgi:3-phosphoshikimate 1-carboxyvinyltransferase
MIQTVVPVEKLSGSLTVPGSKSHTIRALLIASLADGESIVHSPLDSADTRSCLTVCRALGAEILEETDRWLISGTSGKPVAPEEAIDVGNSGTSLYLGAGAAALAEGRTVLTGDEQIRKRPIQPLLDALTGLGADAESKKSNGCAPVLIRGPVKGGKTSIECPTSQYLSSLLLSLPLAEGDSVIDVPLLNEKPYVEMTLAWLDRQEIRYERKGYEQFTIFGGQRYSSFESTIPGDFSTATFFLCAAAITGSTITLNNLDMSDAQGDKEVAEILARMGCLVTIQERSITITGKKMRGRRIDLNAIPDALPALAVTACYAEGTTELVNVPQARLKETDRIAVMREELSACGAEIEERPDGLIIRHSPLKGGTVESHGDHRVAMALAVGALGADRPVAIHNAEAVGVTVPEFFPLLTSLYR